jgi:zinc protease
MKQLSSILLITGLSFSAFGQHKQIQFEEYNLPNGMHVILHKDNSNPIVAVSIMYHVGSKNENPNRTGFAHFFEHLMFEGTQHIDRGEYSRLVEMNGGTLNANTSQDRTYYYEILPSNQLELGLWLESERLLHAKVDSVGIETQRQVVKEEKRQRVDNQPYGSFMEKAFALMFKKHPYNWVPIGSMEHLDAAQEEDYIQFYRDFYVPNNATLSIAGDIDIESAKKLIQKYFGSIPSGEKLNAYRDLISLPKADVAKKYNVSEDKLVKALAKSKPMEVIDLLFKHVSSTPKPVVQPQVVEPALDGVIEETVYDEVQLPAAFICYRMPAQNSDDFYSVQMLTQVLSGGSSSRLNKSVVEKQELAVTAFSFPFPLEHPGMALILGIASAGVNASDLRKAMDVEIELLQNELISEEEYQKLQNSFETEFYSSNSSMAGIAEALANNYVYFGNTNLINSELERYRKVTREDIRAAARKYFDANQRVILYYLPKGDQDQK